MCEINNAKSQSCELKEIIHVTEEIFILYVNWEWPPPRAGQFFMIKPERSSVFLPRPIGIFEYNPREKLVKFLITKAGRGTIELSKLNPGEKIRLSGPFGNAWADFLPESGKAALISGSAGIAPLAALAAERPDFTFHLYAGFKNGFEEKIQENLVLGSAIKSEKIVIAAEDGKNANKGLILDFFSDPCSYDVIFACGSTPMLKIVKIKCKSADVPCFLSLESRMACGAGACLGCTIRTVNGNRRCCSDGPIFPAGDVIFND
ncbi:MAG: dihydroorotate dehydrogenase electron transfer subunit [Treponema sp.]|jgi:NAD(P)H-flavin reductase|nr:dihydroorotate dehydrogenase electron transfer subunit [Treponema sp.]